MVPIHFPSIVPFLLVTYKLARDVTGDLGQSQLVCWGLEMSVFESSHVFKVEKDFGKIHAHFLNAYHITYW